MARLQTEEEDIVMDAHMLSLIANFILSIADDCLRDVYVLGITAMLFFL